MGLAVCQQALEAPLELYINRRSLPYLQEVQRSILHAKEGRGQVFERSGAVGGEVNLCVFSSCVQELEFLVSLVGQLTQHEASRVCFIVRNRATADGLVQQLESLAIPFRDERFDVQEILSEPLADCILAWIRLGIEENPGSRQRLYQFVDNVLGLLDDDTHYTRALERSLENGLKVFRAQCDVSDPSRNTLRKGIDWLLREFLGLKQIAATWSQYGQGDRLLSVIKRVGALLQEARDRTPSWREALNLVEGVGALRIMTVHKCKGLEFDSVVVVGLEDQTFSGDNTLEEWCCFYVAASRAKSRMWFTTATMRGGNTSTFLRTQPLHRALEQAGVERTEYDAVSW